MSQRRRSGAANVSLKLRKAGTSPRTRGCSLQAKVVSQKGVSFMSKTIRNTLLASGAVLLLSTGIAAAAPATAESDVNVRSGPGPGYPVVGVLRAGETVDVAGCTGSWCRVRAPSGSGFASRNYLALAGGGPSVGVAVTPGYVDGGYAYNDYPYGYDDYYDY